jgi:hypothetical protein
MIAVSTGGLAAFFVSGWSATDSSLAICRGHGNKPGVLRKERGIDGALAWRLVSLRPVS